MSIGPDIKEVLEEVGTSFSYLSGETWVSGEYLRFQPNRQVTKPFIKEFFLEVELAYDTHATGGDVLKLTTQNQPYILVNRSAAEFEGLVYKYDAVLYKANVIAQLQRQSGEMDVNYRYNPSFGTIYPTVYGLLTEVPVGNAIDEESQIGRLDRSNFEFFVPNRYGVVEGDRVYISDTEYYKVSAVRRRSYFNVDVAELEEDKR
jgi:hypothetical protein